METRQVRPWLGIDRRPVRASGSRLDLVRAEVLLAGDVQESIEVVDADLVQMVLQVRIGADRNVEQHIELGWRAATPFD